VDAEVAVDSGAVEAQVDTKGHRRPCRVLGAAVEADLVASVEGQDAAKRTLFAGLDLSFSKILSDSAFVANAMVGDQRRQTVERRSTQAGVRLAEGSGLYCLV
jgi:hypothetical protein